MSACAGLANHIRSLEHVQVQLSLSYSRRGDLEISLTSPMGTRSTLVAIRCGRALALWACTGRGQAHRGVGCGLHRLEPHGGRSLG